MPEFFNAKKYKTLADQAKAQRELEKKLGSFVGAPDKYALPDGVTDDDPYIGKLVEFGKKHNMSQEAFAELVATDTADAAAYVAQQKAAIGPDADKRIASVAQWGKANLSDQDFNDLKAAMTSAESFKVIERLVSMNRQAPLPKAGEDVPAAASITPEAVRALHNEVDSQGRRKYDYDPDHRKKVKDAYSKMYGDQPYQEIR